MSIVWRAIPYVLKFCVEFLAEHLFTRATSSLIPPSTPGSLSSTSKGTTTLSSLMMMSSPSSAGNTPKLLQARKRKGCMGTMHSAGSVFISLVLRLGMAWALAGASFLFVVGKESWDTTTTDVRTAYLGVSNGKCDGDMTGAQRIVCDHYTNTLNSYFAVLLLRNFITGTSAHAATFASNAWTWINDSTVGWAIWIAIVLVLVVLGVRLATWVSSLFSASALHASVRAYDSQQEAYYRAAPPALKNILNTPQRFCAASPMEVSPEAFCTISGRVAEAGSGDDNDEDPSFHDA